MPTFTYCIKTFIYVFVASATAFAITRDPLTLRTLLPVAVAGANALAAKMSPGSETSGNQLNQKG